MDDMTINVKLWTDIVLTKEGHYQVITFAQQEGCEKQIIYCGLFMDYQDAAKVAEKMRRGR